MKKDEKTISKLVNISSPIGPLELEATPKSLLRLQFSNEEEMLPANDAKSFPILHEAHRQLDEYFSGDRKTFNLALQLVATEFEQAVWHELTRIPYGTTITYKQLAQRLGDKNKVRAVGSANGKNPLPIIVPCHRVVGSDNQLIGYSGGIERKKWLLRHEGAILL